MNEWISVKDRLPDAEEKVVFIGIFSGQPHLCFGYRNSGEPESKWWQDLTERDIDGDTLDVYDVTHWLEIPPIPNAPTPAVESPEKGGER